MRYSSFIPPILWTAFIAVISLINSSNVPSNDWLDRIHADKIVHAVLYAVLFILYARAFEKSTDIPNVIAVSSGIAILTGIVIEMLQWLIATGRYFDLLDIIANITGVIITLFFIKNHRQKES